MNFKFTESVVEIACLDYFGQLGYTYLPAPEIASDGLFLYLKSVLRKIEIEMGNIAGRRGVARRLHQAIDVGVPSAAKVMVT